MRSQNEVDEIKVNSRSIQMDLDIFEARLSELRISYEQYFSALIPFQPTKEHDGVKKMVRDLLRTPFKNSQTNFRMKNLILRYQTLNTHWERILKERENGTYKRDKFRASIRSEAQKNVQRNQSDEGQREGRFKALYDSYRSALDAQGLALSNLEFAKFRTDLEKKAELLSSRAGGKKVKFAIEVGEGKVSIKAKVENSP